MIRAVILVKDQYNDFFNLSNTTLIFNSKEDLVKERKSFTELDIESNDGNITLVLDIESKQFANLLQIKVLKKRVDQIIMKYVKLDIT